MNLSSLLNSILTLTLALVLSALAISPASAQTAAPLTGETECGLGFHRVKITPTHAIESLHNSTLMPSRVIRVDEQESVHQFEGQYVRVDYSTKTKLADFYDLLTGEMSIGLACK